MKKQHPFFCIKKQCRKSVFETPEYLTDYDLETVEIYTSCLKNNDLDWFYNLAHSDRAEGLFYRILGWSEGWSYCSSYKYCEVTAFPSAILRDLPRFLNLKLEQFFCDLKFKIKESDFDVYNFEIRFKKTIPYTHTNIFLFFDSENNFGYVKGDNFYWSEKESLNKLIKGLDKYLITLV